MFELVLLKEMLTFFGVQESKREDSELIYFASLSDERVC